MRHEKIEGVTHIYVDDGETEQQVLRAIIKASFELARPAGMGWLHFTADSKIMTDEEADTFITSTPRYHDDKSAIEMDYVQGRQCKTYINKVENGHFALSNHSYERDRGTPEPMLERAKEIMVGEIITEGLISTSHMYKGESLTLRMKEYGFSRKNGESDWDFRKRVFPDFFEKDGGRAMEFLLGSSAAEWNEIDKLLYLALMRKGELSRPDLIKFAKGFASDPLSRHESLNKS